MWTSAAGDRGTTINRVRLRGAAGLDPLSARLRASRTIEQAAGGVTLPAGAILCVRRLRDPRPRHVSLSTMQPPSAVWAVAVADALGDLAGRAARPARGRVDPGAEAVLFDDCAEMLACLAADWCRGSIEGCWWWRALVAASLDAEAVLRAWLMHPVHVAAAVEALTAVGAAVAFAARLTTRDSAMLLDAIVSSHGLDSRLAATTPPGSAASAASGIVSTAERARASGREPAPADGSLPPWRDLAPEACVSSLRSDQQQVLGVALTARRDPVRARDPLFVRQVEWWREAIAANDTALAARSMTAGAAPAAVQGIAPRPAPSIASVAALSTAHDLTDPAPASPSSLVSAAPHDGADEAVPLLPAAAEPGNAAASPVVTVSDTATTLLSPRSVACPVRYVDTECGGVFYLLNVALALGLYGDFTSPRAPSLAMPIWQFIARVADALLTRRYRRDPVWALLDDLGGPAPRSFEGPPTWRIDSAWLDAFPEPRTWRWSADGDRLRVRHPAGFSLVDVNLARDRSAAQQAKDEVGASRVARSFRLSKTTMRSRGSETAAARWLGWHVTYQRARLARALGVPRSRAGSLLLRHRARVHVTLTHVDVAFSLRDLPIAIRLSGLDRDPGWIPAADRIVSFRYD